MSAPAHRRGFPRGLASLPLIGGGVALIGAPSAVAEPCTVSLLQRYSGWLGREYGETLIELEPLTHPQRLTHPQFMACAQADRRRWCQDLRSLGSAEAFAVPPAMLPSTRAALVLSAVGVDWREGAR